MFIMNNKRNRVVMLKIMDMSFRLIVVFIGRKFSMVFRMVLLKRFFRLKVWVYFVSGMSVVVYIDVIVIVMGVKIMWLSV